MDCGALYDVEKGMQIDARGLGCPRPLLMAKERLDEIQEGRVEILIDSEVSLLNLQKFAQKLGYSFSTQKEEGYYRVIIGKEKAPLNAVEEKEVDEKELLLIVCTDTLGKDERLGKMLMMAFFETVTLYELPHTIFFLNTGVRLTTVDEETVGRLKAIESMGVKIFSCGTCLKFYGLEDKVRVGQIGGMNIVVEGIRNFKKTVWIG